MFGIRWVEFTKTDRTATKQVIFKTEKERQKFAEEIAEKDNFVRIDAFTNCHQVTKS